MIARGRLQAPVWRACRDPRFSTCGSRELNMLDWSDWWQDDGYIHVRSCIGDEGETWHRVSPRPMLGRVCTRLGVRGGWPYWIFDKAENNKQENQL